MKAQRTKEGNFVGKQVLNDRFIKCAPFVPFKTDADERFFTESSPDLFKHRMMNKFIANRQYSPLINGHFAEPDQLGAVDASRFFEDHVFTSIQAGRSDPEMGTGRGSHHHRFNRFIIEYLLQRDRWCNRRVGFFSRKCLVASASAYKQ